MKRIKVAIGIIPCNKSCCVYVSKRLRKKHLENIWEFPGGKVEIGETIEDALIRELYEEVGINLYHYKFLMCQDFCYSNCFVNLYFYLVHSYQGTPWAKEKQEILKIRIDQLPSLVMPKANQDIINTLITNFLNKSSIRNLININNIKSLFY